MSWYLENGKDSDVVISTRIRFARNLSGMQFTNRATDEELEEILKKVKNAEIDKDLHFIKLEDLDELMQNSLVEKHIISGDLLKKKYAGILLNDAEDVSIMINEEDHLRIQVMKAGFELENSLKDAINIDEKIASKLDYAYDEKYGFLTACPTNIGTGLRASVMLHLPALRITGRIEKVLEVINKVNLNVRGIYGEGTEAIGDLYQISNKVSLGVTEEEIIENLGAIVKKVIEQERKAREFLKNNAGDIEDKIYRKFGNLVYAKKMSHSECAKLISIVRMGINMGIITEIDNQKINEINIISKVATLQKYLKKNLDANERDIERAKLIKQIIEK